VTIFYPDISAFQGNISLAGTVAVCAKATEGTGWTSANYSWQKAEAARRGAFFFAYHFLHAGNASAQADYCFNVVGKNVGLMLDWEPAGSSRPGVNDAVAFIERYRALGGTVNIVYLPHWYWAQMGSPSLGAIASRGCYNVNSAYTTYSDNSSNWNSFGGLEVKIWQYTSSFRFSGQNVDFNAFKGTVDELKALVIGKGVNVKPEDLILKKGDTGDAVKYLQGRLNVWNVAHPALVIDGDFGNSTSDAVGEMQKEHGLTVDRVVGPATWAELDKTPPTDPPPNTFPAPANFSLASKLVSVGIKWDAVTTKVNGSLPTGYTVQAYQMNGVKAGEQVVTATSARFDSLTPGWTYNFYVWANGGPTAPPHAQMTVTA
jgi:GH25 family lysozyme M1 (1,4-beta-N-acetylmuramidase)